MAPAANLSCCSCQYFYGFSPLKELITEQLEFYSKPLQTTSYIDPDSGETVTYIQGHYLSRAGASEYSSAKEIECMSREDMKKLQDERKLLMGNYYIYNDYVCTWGNGEVIAPNYLTRTFHSALQ